MGPSPPLSKIPPIKTPTPPNPKNPKTKKKAGEGAPAFLIKISN